MSSVMSGADLPPVDKAKRGEVIRERRRALGIRSVAEFARQHGSIKEDTISSAEHGNASPGTYERLEGWLAEQEANRGRAVVRPIGDPAHGLLEVTVAGNFGVSATVKGPVDNPEALMEMVERLIRRMSTQESQEVTPPSEG